MTLRSVFHHALISRTTIMDVFLFTATAAAFHYSQRIGRNAGSRSFTTTTNVRSSGLFNEALSPFDTPPSNRNFALPSHQFPSLDFGKFPLIGLLFAAGWCPDCQEGVPLVSSVISSPSNQLADGAGSHRLIEVYYVSSDATEQDMIQFKPDVYRTVPFEPSEERTLMKRLFQVCAKKEMEIVGVVERKQGIPSLIILDGRTGQMITNEGFEDCTRGMSPFEVLQKWKSKLPPASTT